LDRDCGINLAANVCGEVLYLLFLTFDVYDMCFLCISMIKYLVHI